MYDVLSINETSACATFLISNMKCAPGLIDTLKWQTQSL